MKKSDKVEARIKLQLNSGKEPTWLEIWEGICTTKALLKHIIDNELPHIWRVILIILSAIIGGALTALTIILKLKGIL